MARTKVDRAIALKNFVDVLMANSPGAKTFTRSDVEVVGKSNPIGQCEFASVAIGYGSQTRIGRGIYAIPSDWLADKAPWTGISENVVVASTKAPKTPKADNPAKEPKAKAKKAAASVDEVTETVVVEAPVTKKIDPKKALSKKELFERAKAEIANRKKKDVVN